MSVQGIYQYLCRLTLAVLPPAVYSASTIPQYPIPAGTGFVGQGVLATPQVSFYLMPTSLPCICRAVEIEFSCLTGGERQPHTHSSSPIDRYVSYIATELNCIYLLPSILPSIPQ